MLAIRQQSALAAETPVRICIEVDGLQLALTEFDHGAEAT
jgi:hypothetical protein